jgi:hypothetical protein
MRTTLFILGGFALLAACLAIAKFLFSSLTDPMRIATIAFLALWFVIAASNMWVGVARAGYSVGEELPIFLLIFGLPAAVGILVKWKLL